MKHEVSLNQPHIKLFLHDMKKHGRSIIKLQESTFEVIPDSDGVFLVSGIKQDGNREPILLVTLSEIFDLPFEVLEIDILEEIYDKV